MRFAAQAPTVEKRAVGAAQILDLVSAVCAHEPGVLAGYLGIINHNVGQRVPADSHRRRHQAVSFSFLGALPYA